MEYSAKMYFVYHLIGYTEREENTTYSYFDLFSLLFQILIFQSPSSTSFISNKYSCREMCFPTVLNHHCCQSAISITEFDFSISVLVYLLKILLNWLSSWSPLAVSSTLLFHWSKAERGETFAKMFIPHGCQFVSMASVLMVGCYLEFIFEDFHMHHKYLLMQKALTRHLQS